MFGTFFLCCIVGLTASRENVSPSGLANYGIGMGLMILVYLFGGVSGAHLNPAVTLGCVVARKIDIVLACGYIVSQFIGSVFAAIVWYNLYDAHMQLGVSMEKNMNHKVGSMIMCG